jgi:hypothetical protein
MAIFGRTNRLPKSVVAVLKNSKTAVSHHTGGMSTPHAVDKATGGQGREQSQVMAGESQAVYVNDYEIVGEKEL